MKKFIIITTIHPKSKAIQQYEKKYPDWQLVIVGDKKTPTLTTSSHSTYLSIERQRQLGYHLLKHCPYNHYTRKNIGYIYAIKQGADIIYDTDDDNLPYADWKQPDFFNHRQINSQALYFNVYQYFTKKPIWPRGFPLDELQSKPSFSIQQLAKPSVIGIWQGLVNLDPDVDALYRLIVHDVTVFQKKPAVHLPRGMYCPFNSQNTFWTKALFPLLYLPGMVPMRFCDILRGYIAQELMWQYHYQLGFMQAIVYQKRNQHNLLDDFNDEISMYQQTKPIIKLLQSIRYSKNIRLLGQNIQATYTQLYQQGFIPKQEVLAVKAWLRDIN